MAAQHLIQSHSEEYARPACSTSVLERQKYLSVVVYGQATDCTNAVLTDNIDCAGRNAVACCQFGLQIYDVMLM